MKTAARKTSATVGLHMADVEKLIQVLHRLVNAGHSEVVFKHDLDVIAESDWIMDLGSEGGSGGGVCEPNSAFVHKSGAQSPKYCETRDL